MMRGTRLHVAAPVPDLLGLLDSSHKILHAACGRKSSFLMTHSINGLADVLASVYIMRSYPKDCLASSPGACLTILVLLGSSGRSLHAPCTRAPRGVLVPRIQQTLQYWPCPDE